MIKNTRTPAVAGSFYPDNPDELRDLIHQLLEAEIDEIKMPGETARIIGGIVPHAGFIYSGYEAVHFFELIKRSGQLPETVVILHPNHQGFGPPASVDAADSWDSPLGGVLIDREMAKLLDIPPSTEAHRMEHAAEVMLPFLQEFLENEFRIIPVSMFDQRPETACRLAEAIQTAVKQTGREILLIASSDFSHYVSPEWGAANDKLVIEKILALDVEGVFERIENLGTSICGYGPIMAMIHYARITASSPSAHLLKFGNSAINRSSDSVVDYASLLFYDTE